MGGHFPKKLPRRGGRFDRCREDVAVVVVPAAVAGRVVLLLGRRRRPWLDLYGISLVFLLVLQRAAMKSVQQAAR